MIFNVIDPGDPIIRVDGVNDGDGSIGPPPANEDVNRAIDGLGQKYLNFYDLGSGFAVTPSMNTGNQPVVGLRLFTANDFPERDPASFILEGTNDPLVDGTSESWTVISSGPLSLPVGRNPGNTLIPADGNASASFQEIPFANALLFSSYRITFPTLKNAGLVNSMQIGEVQLLAAVPEPLAAIWAGILALGMVLYRRKR